jgi:hypothetical protein
LLTVPNETPARRATSFTLTVTAHPSGSEVRNHDVESYHPDKLNPRITGRTTVEQRSLGVSDAAIRG